MKKENKKEKTIQEDPKYKKYIKEIIPYIIIFIVVLVIKTYIVTPVVVKGESMTNTLLEKDVMILNKLSYKFNEIKRFDIVVVDKNNSNIIKRVIGLPGEKVKIEDNILYINDKKVDEPYLKEGTETDDFSLKEITKEETIPEGYYFVLGDHREVSLDSRDLGLIKEDEIVGKASLTIFPFSRFGTKK